MIRITLDVMLARRKVSVTELSERVGITMANISILKNEKARAIRLETLNSICRALDCQPGDILEYIPVMYMAAIWAFVLMFLIDYGYYFLTAFAISWGAGVIASFMRLRLGNIRLFKMAVYAGTLSYILAFVQNMIGKSIPNFTFFSLLISTGYMYFALKDYKDSGIEELPPEQFGGREDKF